MPGSELYVFNAEFQGSGLAHTFANARLIEFTMS